VKFTFSAARFYVHTNIYTYIYISIYYVYVCMYVCIYVCMYMYVYIYVNIYIYIYILKYPQDRSAFILLQLKRADALPRRESIQSISIIQENFFLKVTFKRL
jgi:hypothetical protein